MISIHAPRTGSDGVFIHLHTTGGDFNPRSPHGERRAYASHFPRPIWISIHAPRTGSDDTLSRENRTITISIHAPRTGSDLVQTGIFCQHIDFNPRSPHGERQARDSGAIEQDAFQSTLPARGATGVTTTQEMLESISIHAPRTGSDPPFDYNRINAYISIHAPRTGSDVNRFCNRPCINAFQSTLPARGATFQQLMEHNWQIYFNPRSPHGERLAQSIYLSAPVHYFNPRSPHGERRHLRRHRWQAVQISIHAPRTGSDLCPKAARRSGRFQSTLPARGATRAGKGADCDGGDFNPRSPHGERRGDSMADAGVYIISIHAPRTGSDWVAYNVDNEMPISIHAPRTGSDPNARA